MPSPTSSVTFADAGRAQALGRLARQRRVDLDRVHVPHQPREHAPRGSPSRCRRRAPSRRRSSSSSSHMRATTSGCEIVCPAPIGSGMFSHAWSRRSGGTKRVARHLGHRRQHPLVVDVAPQRPHQPLRGGRHHATLAPAARTASERPRRVAGLDVDAARRRAVDRDREALAQRVERRVLDAVVGGQPDDGHVVDVALAQQRGEAACPRSPSSPRSRDPGPCRPRRRSASGRARGGARRPAVPATQCTGHGPPCSANEPWSGGCQSRVATTRSKLARAGELVEPPGDRVAVRHRQRAAGAEVVLEVDDDERAAHISSEAPRRSRRAGRDRRGGGP